MLLEWNLDEAIEAAREEGREDGREEGIEIGLEKGMEEEKLIIAKNLLSERSTPEFVHEITGLSLERIRELDFI